MTMRPVSLTFTAAIVFSGVVAAQAPAPLGSQFQINTFTTSSQGLPKVSPDGAGGVVVVWYSNGSDSTPENFKSIQAQRFAADGSPTREQFQVSTYTTRLQTIPAVGSDGADGFIVAWQSWGSPGTDSVPPISKYSVQARLFDADGSPRGAQFQVNTYTIGHQVNPKLSPDGAGGFVIVWASNGSYGTDTSAGSVQAQRYAADGSPKGDEFQVNTYTSGGQGGAVVSPDGTGGFVVVWNSTDFMDSEIKAQRFHPDGLMNGAEFKVNTDPTGHLPGLAVSPDGAGGFVVVWRNDTSIGPPDPPPELAWGGFDESTVHGRRFAADGSDEPTVHGRRFATDGSPVGDPFQVSSATAPRIINPAISRDGAGGFVVVWQAALSDITPYFWNIWGRQFASDSTPLGDDFLINADTTDDHRVPAVSPDGAGRFIVVWDSTGSAGPDSSYGSVQGQRYVKSEIFTDGFESGDTSAWVISSD